MYMDTLPALHHSFVLQDNGLGRQFAQIACGILSVLYAKRSGYNIVLHTDDEAAKCLDVAPYDEIKCDLNGLDKDYGKWVFAYPKFKAYESMDLGDVHIDMDVFLKKPCVKNDYKDVIVQSIEDSATLDAGHTWNESVRAFSNCEYPNWAKRELKFMYNCGVCGINNGNLKEEYIKTYWEMMSQYKKYGIICPSVVDMIPEQQFLYDIVRYYNYDCKLVLPIFTQQYANEVGYQHLIGISKQFRINKVLEKIYSLNQEIYYKLKNNWNEIPGFYWPHTVTDIS